MNSRAKARPASTGVAIDEPVDQADALRLLGLDGAAGHDHLQRARLADHARQALRAAIARDQPELDLRQAHLGVAGRQSRNVQASASSSPPPKAKPLITAIDGIGSASSLANTAWPELGAALLRHRGRDCAAP